MEGVAFDTLLAAYLLDPAGTVVYSTYFGAGGGVDEGTAIAADERGDAYVVGDTYGSSLPLVNPAYGGGLPRIHPNPRQAVQAFTPARGNQRGPAREHSAGPPVAAGRRGRPRA